jgi:hypothetical protein
MPEPNPHPDNGRSIIRTNTPSARRIAAQPARSGSPVGSAPVTHAVIGLCHVTCMVSISMHGHRHARASTRDEFTLACPGGRRC